MTVNREQLPENVNIEEILLMVYEDEDMFHVIGDTTLYVIPDNGL